ncbi:hypothetical protein BDR26DRAFT_853028 [Obelidium mucronatum]|nr:hypothetical protein BDR26DRAFT_853028 [Obelidium mucronatum]
MKAIVIGSGPVGLSTAFGLKKQGFEVAVYDRFTVDSAVSEARQQVKVMFGETQGGAVSLYQNGMAALQNLGLLESVLESPHIEVSDFTMCKMDGSDPIPHYYNAGKPSIQILRSDVHTPIMKACNFAGIRTFLSKKLVGLEQSKDSVLVRFEDGTVDTADFVIGADGIHSVTRQLIFPEAPKPTLWCMGYIGVFSRDTVVGGDTLGFNKDMKIYSDPLTGNMVFCGHCSDKYGAYFILQVNEEGKEKAHLDSSWRPYSDLPKESTKLAGVLESWGLPENVVAVVRHSLRITPVAIYDLPNLPTFHKGRVLLVGDAAHGTVPASGQGLCSGLEDAAALMDLFQAFSPNQYETVFKLFDKARIPRIKKIYASARDVAARMKAGTPLKAAIGRFMMRAVFGILSHIGRADEIVNYNYRTDVEKVLSEYTAATK